MLTLPQSSTLHARRLGEADLAALQALCEACADYYTLVYGAPAGPEEAGTLLTELPPGRTLADKFFLGLFTPRPRLCGVLDLVRDVREPGEWYLGLLLLEPAARGQGHGEAVLRAAEDFVRAQGGHRLRLACADQNTAGRRFWERQGYREDKRFAPRRLGVRETVLTEFVRTLSAPATAPAGR
jgi:ribosomal protein S18 acetylase RimI-like enzyme